MVQEEDFGQYIKVSVDGTDSTGFAVGGNVAFRRTASSDSAYWVDAADQPPYLTADSMVDGEYDNGGYRQRYNSAKNVRYIIDLGSVQNVNRLVIHENNNNNNFKFENYAVEVSEKEGTLSDADWKTVITGTDTSKHDVELNFKTAQARQICFKAIATNTTGKRPCVREIEVFNVVGTPIIALEGEPTVRLALGQEYVEAGVTADDGSGNDISNEVQTSGAVNNKQVGTYTLTYSIPDRNLSVTRTVEVYAKTINVAATNGVGAGNTLGLSDTENAYSSATVQWISSDSLTGTYAPIEGATDRTYTIKSTDKGKYIKASVRLGEGYSDVMTTNALCVGNLVFGKAATGANGSFQNDGQKSNLTDGNAATETRTSSSGSVSGKPNPTEGDAAFTYCFDLGKEQYMDRMVVRQREQNSRKLIAWKVQYSNAENPSTAADSTDWTDVETNDDLTDQGEKWTEKTMNFTPVKARHIRFVVTSINVGWGGVYYLQEIEVINTHAVEKPVITLNGDAAMSVNIGETFTDPGAVALDSDGLSTIPVTVGGTVDTNTPGRYTLTYNVTGSNGVAAEEKTRLVTVVAADPPVITLKGDAEMTVYKGRTFTDPGATAVDLNHADISANIVVTGTVDTAVLGDYTLEYNVTDSRGVAAAAVRRTVHVVEAKPVITLKGDAEMTVLQGRKFTDPGATATDVDGNNLTASIVVTGADGVDTSKAGRYTITYNVTDAAGTSADPVTRTVTVVGTAISLNYTSAMPGGVLSASYTWDGYDAANGAAYQWVRASSVKGDYEPIAGATGETYTLSGADIGKYIKLTITPEDAPAATTPTHVSVGNVALGKSITSVNGHASHPASNLNDGNMDTYVRGQYGSTPDAKFTIDLGSEQPISLARLYSQDLTAKKIQHFTIDYTTSASGDDDWHVLVEVNVDTTATTSLDSVVWNFDRVTARRVRMNIDKCDTVYSGTFYLDELEFYNAANGTPTLTLNGDSRMSVEVGTPFTDPGVTAVDEAGIDLSAAVVVSGDTVNTSKLGTYTLNYDVTDAWGNKAKTVTRTVVVREKDTQPPVITLKGAATIRISQGGTWTDPGVIVTDNADTELPVTVGGDTVDTAALGEYTITYDATDKSGNHAKQVIRKVVVVAKGEDVEPPVVTLKGAAEVEVWQGYSYTEQGATARDGSTDVTSSIKIEGTVDTKTLGTYVLTYSVSDAAGNVGVATRIVKVVEEPAIERDTRELKIEGASDLQAIVNDLILRIRGTYGSTIRWESSNENVIRADGTVIRPSSDTTVVLKAIITNGEETREKTFDPVKVLKSTGNSSGGGIGGGGSAGGGRPGGSNTVIGTGGALNPVNPTTPSTPQQPNNNGTLSGFSDMNQAAWADLAVSELSKRGIINGVGDGTFQPQRAVTREEFVKIVVEAFGFGTGAAAANFSDVSAQEWYYPYVASATQLGIVGGSGDGSFGTGRAITREEMAAMICRAAAAKGLELKATKEKTDFTDNSTISDWALDNVYTLQQAGVISGMGDGSFAPAQQCTRAEAAKVVYELTKYMW